MGTSPALTTSFVYPAILFAGLFGPGRGCYITKENSLPPGRPTPQAPGRQAVHCMCTALDRRLYMTDLSCLPLGAYHLY